MIRLERRSRHKPGHGEKLLARSGPFSHQGDRGMRLVLKLNNLQKDCERNNGEYDFMLSLDTVGLAQLLEGIAICQKVNPWEGDKGFHGGLLRAIGASAVLLESLKELAQKAESGDCDV